MFTIRTVCEIKQILKMPEDRFVLVETYHARLLKVVQSSPFMQGKSSK